MVREAEFDSVLVWFRRDLRVDDHAALRQAVRRARRVHCAFVFDREILDPLPDRHDRRVEFIHASVAELDAALRRAGGALRVRHANARDAIPALAAETGAQAVLANHDYEPAARDRDAEGPVVALAQLDTSDGARTGVVAVPLATQPHPCGSAR